MTAYDEVLIEENVRMRELLDLFLQVNQIPGEEVTYYKENTVWNADADWDDHSLIKIRADGGLQTDISQEHFDFLAYSSLVFTPIKDYITRPVIWTAMLRLVLAVIERQQGCVAILLENLAEKVLLYKDGKLTIWKHRFWTPERLAMLNMPYIEVEEESDNDR